MEVISNACCLFNWVLVISFAEVVNELRAISAPPAIRIRSIRTRMIPIILIVMILFSVLLRKRLNGREDFD